MSSLSKKMFRRKAIFAFTRRLVASSLLVAIFFVVTQDIQIFPGVMSGLSQPAGVPSETLPKGITEFFVDTFDEERIQTWYYPYLGGESKGVVIFFHGNGDTLSNLVGTQRWISEAGFDVYVFDYRGYGRSTGWPSEEGLQFDAEAVYHFVASRHDLANTSLLYFAVSIGTGPAAYLASKYPPTVLTLIAPLSSMKDVVADQALIGFLTPFLWYSFPVAHYLQAVNESCIVLAHGRGDTIIPVSHTERLSSQLRRKGVYTYYSKKAGHNDILKYLGKSVLKKMVECVDSDVSAGG